jgi:hypothetical protein
MDNLILQINLAGAKTLDDIVKICAGKRKVCISNKDFICRRIMEISGYKVNNSKYNFCELFSEILGYSRTISRDRRPSNLVKFSDEIVNDIKENGGSKNLIKFINEHLPPGEKIIFEPGSPKVTDKPIFVSPVDFLFL